MDQTSPTSTTNKNAGFSPLKVAGLVTFLVLMMTAGIIGGLNNQKKELTSTNSKAAEIVPGLACDMTIVIGTPTLTPTLTPTPTPTISPTITPTPTLACENMNLALVIDRSSTMNDMYVNGRKKLEWAKDAAKAVANALANSNPLNVKLSVASFGRQGNDNTGLFTPYETYNSTLDVPLTTDYVGAVTKIANITWKASGTCVLCGLRIGNNEVSRTAGIKKYSILLSDGMANTYWNGDGQPWTTTNNPMTAAIAEANIGRSMGVEYRVIGFGDRAVPYPTPNASISEPTLKAIACANPADTACIAANYSYQPDATQWANTFIKTLYGLCNGATPTPTTYITPTATRVPTATPTRKVTPTPTKRPPCTGPNCSTISL